MYIFVKAMTYLSSKTICVGTAAIGPLTTDATLIPRGSNSELKTCAIDRRASSRGELDPYGAEYWVLARIYRWDLIEPTHIRNGPQSNQKR